MKIKFIKPRAVHTRNMKLGPLVVGTVERDDGNDPGALVKDEHGVYWQANFGQLRPLDQDDVIAALPAPTTYIYTGESKPRNIVLSDRDVDTFKAYGAGNMTAGMRLAADLVRLCEGKA